MHSRERDRNTGFLKDLLLPSIHIQSGLELIRTVLDKLDTESLKLNMSKCSLLQNSITYLGYEISPESKLAAVSQFPTPHNVHELQ